MSGRISRIWRTCLVGFLLLAVAGFGGREPIPNAPPVADDQSVTTDEDTAVAVTLTASDDEGDPLSWHVDTPPSH